MANSTCDPCCNPVEAARANESFKAAVLILLCKILVELDSLLEKFVALGGGYR
jgi:hypothetical protein